MFNNSIKIFSMGAVAKLIFATSSIILTSMHSQDL